MFVKNPVSDLKDTNYLFVKATLKRCGFRTDLKFSRDTSTCSSIWLDDLSFGDDFLMDTSSRR